MASFPGEFYPHILNDIIYVYLSKDLKWSSVIDLSIIF